MNNIFNSVIDEKLQEINTLETLLWKGENIHVKWKIQL